METTPSPEILATLLNALFQVLGISLAVLVSWGLRYAVALVKVKLGEAVTRNIVRGLEQQNKLFGEAGHLLKQEALVLIPQAMSKYGVNLAPELLDKTIEAMVQEMNAELERKPLIAQELLAVPMDTEPAVKEPEAG